MESDAARELNIVLCPATAGQPRQSEGSVLPMGGGRLLLAYSDFYGGEWRDEGPARIAGRWSDDEGLSWSEPLVLQENIGRLNCMSASLLRTRSGRVLLAFGRKDGQPGLAGGPAVLDAMVKHSDDGGRTWSEPVSITPGGRYWCITNDRLVELSSGRVLYPLHEDTEVGCHSWMSDDDGRTWRMGAGSVRSPEGVAYEEPTVVELPDGRVGMFVRTNAGNIHMFRSSDGGDTWEPWKTHALDMAGHPDAGPNAARSPCMVKRVPGTDDLLLIWNNNRVRTPLTAAISSDGGESWRHFRDIEPMTAWPPQRTHTYPSLAFSGENVHITYWEAERRSEAEFRVSLRYRRLPVDWFYKK